MTGHRRLPPLLLATASLRRRCILQSLGITFDTDIPGVREIALPHDPRGSAIQNAMLKLDWCRKKYRGHAIITADTIVVFKDKPIGKPASIRQARQFLRMFAGCRQSVITAVAFSLPGKPPAVKVAESFVTFRRLSDGQIREYLAQVDPLDKAGGYDIDQRGEKIIRSFTGSRTNIMGLPARIVSNWLRKNGYMPAGRPSRPRCRGCAGEAFG